MIQKPDEEYTHDTLLANVTITHEPRGPIATCSAPRYHSERHETTLKPSSHLRNEARKRSRGLAQIFLSAMFL